MKGGIGVAVVEANGAAACAIAAVNAFGDVCDAAGQRDRRRAPRRRVCGTERVLAEHGMAGAFGRGHNTTVAVVAVDGVLDKLALQGVARAAGAALHRRVRPAGSMVDGDVIFALCPLAGRSGRSGARRDARGGRARAGHRTRRAHRRGTRRRPRAGRLGDEPAHRPSAPRHRRRARAAPPRPRPRRRVPPASRAGRPRRWGGRWPR